MRKVVTKEDVIAAKGGQLEVGADDLVTAAALEAATRASVAIVRKSEDTPSAPPSPAMATASAALASTTPSTTASATGIPGPWDSFASGSAASSKSDGAPAAIVTAVGKNRPFVLAEITTKIGELNGDIYDISQRIVSGYFSTILVVDIGRVSTDFAGFKRAIEGLSKDGDYKIVVQHERVFRAMHRI